MIFNWQTTVVGVLTFIVGGCAYMKWISSENAAAIIGALSGLLGLLAKDRNVTGGTRAQ